MPTRINTHEGKTPKEAQDEILEGGVEEEEAPMKMGS